MQPSALISGLISVYQKAIDSCLQETDEGAIECCFAYGVSQGVCAAMAHNFGRNSSEMLANFNSLADILSEYYDTGTRWFGKQPCQCSTKEQLIEALEYRLDILKNIQYESC